MTDLVKRLRDVQENWPWCEIELEAADRIEALEAALRNVQRPCIKRSTGEFGWCGRIGCPCMVARAALAGEKKDE